MKKYLFKWNSIYFNQRNRKLGNGQINIYQCQARDLDGWNKLFTFGIEMEVDINLLLNNI